MNEKVERIQTDIKYNRIKGELLPILQDIIQVTVEKQERKEVGATAFMLIAYLRSSIVTGSHQYMVMMAEKILYLDEKRTERYWYPEQIYKEQAEDVLKAQKEITKHFIRVSDYEMEFIRQLVEADYISLTEIQLSEQIEAIQKLKAFESMIKQENFQCYFGEYMGEIKVLSHFN